jgi:hypothetical protein
MNDHIAMKGGGYYSLATLGAKHVIDGATPLVLDAVARMPASEGPFVVSDMGTADGGTSLDLLGRIVEAVRQRWANREIAIVHTDQPRNDFNALVANVHGRPWSAGVYVLQSATSFYNPALRDARSGIIGNRHALAQHKARRHHGSRPGGGGTRPGAGGIHPPGQCRLAQDPASSRGGDETGWPPGSGELLP